MVAFAKGWGWRWAYAVARAAMAWDHTRADLRKPASWAPGGRALLTPMAMGFGVAAYIGLAEEPATAIGVAWLGLTVWLWVVTRRVFAEGPLITAIIIALWAGAGFVRMDARTASIASPAVTETGEPRRFSGWVERIDASNSAHRRRYVVRLETLEGAAPDEVPLRVRVSAPAGAAWLGDDIEGDALLYAPPTPSVPGAYDFARAAYFQQLGGVGRVVGALTVSSEVDAAPRLAQAITRLRGRMAERLLRYGGPEAGPVLAALVTGHRGDITAEVNDDLRAASLGHVLAISGLHMALVGGGAFFLLVKLFAAIEPWARRTDVRKPAAIAALAAATAYLVLSGASVSAQRAYVMTAVALAAIVLDRRALSLASVARAGVIVLLLRPEAALEPGFQMSFAATASLIAVHGATQRRRIELGTIEHRAKGPLASARRFLVATAVTSLVAGLATAPFAAYHFNRVAHAGLAANIVAMPVFTLAVMPSAAAAGALAPLGLDEPPAVVASKSLDAVFALSRAVTPSQNALAPVPAAPPAAMALIVIGLVVWCGRSIGRWRVAAPLWASAALLWGGAPKPHLWLGLDGGVAAHFVGQSGMEASHIDRYGAELFLRRVGANTAATASDLNTVMRCDDQGCVGEAAGRRVAVVREFGALADDCRRADLVVVIGWLPNRADAVCNGTRVLATGDIAGPTTIRLSRYGVEVRAVPASDRPWSVGGDQL